MILLFKWNDKKFSFLLSVMNVDVSAKKKKTRIVSVSKRWLHHDLSVADRPLNHVPHLIASRVRMAAPRLDVTSTHRESRKDGKKTNVFRFYFCPLERSRISDVAWRTPVLAPFDAREPFRCSRSRIRCKGPLPPRSLVSKVKGFAFRLNFDLMEN